MLSCSATVHFLILLKNVLLSDIQIFSQSLVPSHMGASYRQDVPSYSKQNLPPPFLPVTPNNLYLVIIPLNFHQV